MRAARVIPAETRKRLAEAGRGHAPWISTMTPAELLIVRSHGVRPVATVCGTCWFQHRDETIAHAKGWRLALKRLADEARACGANAVVDVKLRAEARPGHSTDFSLVGAAVKVDGLPASRAAVIATTPALEFTRLLEAGIVPAGIAVGARLGRYRDYRRTARGRPDDGGKKLRALSNFWEKTRREAFEALRKDASGQGGGVLAHTQFGELAYEDGAYLCRQVVIGTLVETIPKAPVPYVIASVVDLRDEISPLHRASLAPVTTLNPAAEGATR